MNANVPDSEYATNSHSYTCTDANIDPLTLLSIPKTPYVHKVCDGVYVSQVSNVSLLQYVTMVFNLCNTVHNQPCLRCPPLLKVADIILKEGACPLRQAFELTSPGVTYDTEKARRKLLVMPLASIRMGDPFSGAASTLLMEFIPGVNYQNIANILNAVKSPCAKDKRLDKASVQKLLGLATSDRERECSRYALFKASGMTQTQARREYGFENMDARATEVEKCIVEASKIRKAIDELACIQDKAFLVTLGVLSDSDDPVSSSDEDDAVSPDSVPSTSLKGASNAQNDSPNTLSSIVSMEMFKSLLTASKFNWFQVVERIEQPLDDSLRDQLPQYLEGS